jgi:Primase zinc finger
VGWSFDFAYCKGKKKNGESCRNCVNKTKSEFCDWHLSQGHKRLAFGARPECTGTVLGAAVYQPGKEKENFAFRGKIITKKTVPKTLGVPCLRCLQCTNALRHTSELQEVIFHQLMLSA